MKKAFLAVMAVAAIAMSMSSCKKAESNLSVEGQWFCGREMPYWTVLYVVDVRVTHPDSVYFASGLDGTDPVIQSAGYISRIEYDDNDHSCGKIITRDRKGEEGYMLFKNLSKDYMTVTLNQDGQAIDYVFGHPSTKLKLVYSDL